MRAPWPGGSIATMPSPTESDGVVNPERTILLRSVSGSISAARSVARRTARLAASTPRSSSPPTEISPASTGRPTCLTPRAMGYSSPPLARAHEDGRRRNAELGTRCSPAATGHRVRLCRRAARVLVRGGPPRGGGDRTRAGPPASGSGFPARNVGRPRGADPRPLRRAGLPPALLCGTGTEGFCDRIRKATRRRGNTAKKRSSEGGDMARSVTVIGAGIVGISCARYCRWLT